MRSWMSGSVDMHPERIIPTGTVPREDLHGRESVPLILCPVEPDAGS